MPDTSLTNKDPTTDLMECYRRDCVAILADFLQCMTLREAENKYSFPHGYLRAAFERGELELIQVTESRYRVTPAALANHIRDFCIVRRSPIPS